MVRRAATKKFMRLGSDPRRSTGRRSPDAGAERDSSDTNAGFVGSNGRRAASSGHERDEDEDHGDSEQHMSNPGRIASQTARTERFGYQSKNLF
jgi:hypothetical protein